MDLWAQELINQDNMWSTEFSSGQIAYLKRGKALKSAGDWINWLKNVGILSKADAAHATEYRSDNASTTTLATLLASMHIPVDEFRTRLLAKGLKMDFAANVARLVHYESQFSLYLKSLQTETRKERASGKPKFTAQATPELLSQIYHGEEVFTSDDESLREAGKRRSVAPRKTVTICEDCYEEVRGNYDTHSIGHLIARRQATMALLKKENRSTRGGNSIRGVQGGLPSLNRKRR